MSGKGAERVAFEQKAAKVIYVTDATYQMKVNDHLVRASGASNTVDITLPSMAEAAGKLYHIIATNVSNDVSILIKETGNEHGSGDFDTADDQVLLFCTGTEWLDVSASHVT